MSFTYDDESFELSPEQMAEALKNNDEWWESQRVAFQAMPLDNLKANVDYATASRHLYPSMDMRLVDLMRNVYGSRVAAIEGEEIASGIALGRLSNRRPTL